MWFLNKKTGLKWLISDKEHIERLRKDDDYEEIKEEVIEEIKTTSKKSTVKK